MSDTRAGDFNLLLANQVQPAFIVPMVDRASSSKAGNYRLAFAEARRAMHGLLDVQVSATKPATRHDTTALVVGDRWLDTTDRLWFFWNGTYWLSEQIFAVAANLPTDLSDNGGFGMLTINPAYNLFLLRFEVAGVFQLPSNASNNWTFNLSRRLSNLTAATIASINTAAIASASCVTLAANINTHVDVNALSVGVLRLEAIHNGSPGNVVEGTARTTFRLAKP